ncbi:hypothetical protein GCM10022222_38200 [Amycolatopsis ultiminotia]|uniref:Uncharacterized protein n=1 Tax=Amycolatopsis ultiminotia TaxID=543629 RepID=A0ABP6WJG1_9PSEU
MPSCPPEADGQDNGDGGRSDPPGRDSRSIDSLGKGEIGTALLLPAGWLRRRTQVRQAPRGVAGRELFFDIEGGNALMEYTKSVTSGLSFEAVVTKVREPLTAEGFGVLTEIDVAAGEPDGYDDPGDDAQSVGADRNRSELPDALRRAGRDVVTIADGPPRS